MEGAKYGTSSIEQCCYRLFLPTHTFFKNAFVLPEELKNCEGHSVTKSSIRQTVKVFHNAYAFLTYSQRRLLRLRKKKLQK